MIRIAMIGAGSVVFERNLLADILGLEALRDCAIALHDIDPERLDTAALMASRVAAQLGAAPSITAHADRRAALEGADFVINMVQIGMHAATLLDFDIPRRYGLKQTIADTVGIFRGLRIIPFMQAMVRDMRAVCPGALLLNYTNPMSMLTWAVYDAFPAQRVVGLCHNVQYTARAGGVSRRGAGAPVVRLRRHQPHDLVPAPGGRRQGRLSRAAPRRREPGNIRRRPRALRAAAPVRLVRQRIERAHRGIHAVFPAPPRPDRGLPRAGG
jgi:hypothetical protein